MTLRSIQFKNNTISYELTYKRVKNINLRIKSDCTISVSAGRSVPVAMIDNFVLSKGQFILDALKKYSEHQKHTHKITAYESGETVWLLGRGLKLVVLEGGTEAVEADNNNLFLTVKNSCDTKRKKLLVERFTAARCQTVFEELINEVYKHFEKYGVPFPKLKIRRMKSRWGSCQPKSGIITLNAMLIEAPESCIRYVVLHEYCHFIHPNHSKNFYRLVESLMPDWKERKKRLNGREYLTLQEG